jgi:hypothetical protein
MAMKLPAQNLKQKIREACLVFTKETGCVVSGISLDDRDFIPMPADVEYLYVGLEVM